jgi:hypothetical protein
MLLTRLQVYQHLGDDPEDNYNPKGGLFLDSGLKQEFDALHWSLYHKVSRDIPSK